MACGDIVDPDLMILPPHAIAKIALKPSNQAKATLGGVKICSFNSLNWYEDIFGIPFRSKMHNEIESARMSEYAAFETAFNHSRSQPPNREN
jgi:hypothetical protein